MAAISLVLPAGGAILTIWNLRRLRQVDTRAAWRLTVMIGALFVIGYGILGWLSQRVTHGQPKIDSTAVAIIACGVATASYLTQRPAFQNWRAGNAGVRSGSWLTAIGIAVLDQVAWGLVFIPILVLISVVFNLHWKAWTP